MLLMAIHLPCKADAPREDQVKAAFIYNFTQFVTWPQDAFASNNSPFVIAIVGDDPYSGASERAMAGKFVNGRRIAISHFASLERMERCQLLIVSASQQGAASEIL